MPATVYFFKSFLIESLTTADKTSPFFGLTVMKTFPNSGGSSSSPPYALTESTFGYKKGIRLL